jgi:hypothetical protein
MYSRFTPTCFCKWFPYLGGRRCLRSHSSSVCIVGLYGLRSIQDNWPHGMDCNAYTPPIQTLPEWLLRHLRPPEYGNHLPKHVGVNLEYINKSNQFLDALVGDFATILQNARSIHQEKARKLLNSCSDSFNTVWNWYWNRSHRSWLFKAITYSVNIFEGMTLMVLQVDTNLS